jgi:hypothetical protein
MSPNIGGARRSRTEGTALGEYQDALDPWGFKCGAEAGAGAPTAKDGWPQGRPIGLPRTGPMVGMCCGQPMERLDTTVPHIYLHKCQKCGNEVNEVDARGPSPDR